ncbi:MAG: hypothetical protein IRZ16_15920 [Myxococcaceae bacterium]|nr:hypothetical protein [Myxococcaceae bacterium]
MDTTSPDPASPPPRALRFVWPVQLAVIVALALWALVFQVRLPSKLPTAADYRAVADVLEREARPGDVVFVYPWWADRVRTFIPDSIPVVGYLDDEDDPLLRHRRIWLLAQPNLPKSDLDGFLAIFGRGRTRVGTERAFGNLVLSLWDNGRYRPIRFSAPDALGTGRVYLEHPDGERVDCPWRGDRFVCPGPWYLHVKTGWHEVKFQPRRCIWMHPPGGDARLVLELPGALEGAKDALLETGYIWDTGFRHGAGNTTTYVRADDGAGHPLADVALPPGLEGMQRAVLALTPDSGSTLRVSVQSRDTDARWICVDALAFDAGGSAPPTSGGGAP